MRTVKGQQVRRAVVAPRAVTPRVTRDVPMTVHGPVRLSSLTDLALGGWDVPCMVWKAGPSGWVQVRVTEDGTSLWGVGSAFKDLDELAYRMLSDSVQGFVDDPTSPERAWTVTSVDVAPLQVVPLASLGHLRNMVEFMRGAVSTVRLIVPEGTRALPVAGTGAAKLTASEVLVRYRARPDVLAGWVNAASVSLQLWTDALRERLGALDFE